jgi:hypothetical protein
MNCDEYRQTIAADPATRKGEDHASVCVECRRYRDEIRALDADIAKALQIAVPPLVKLELPDIRADNVVALAARKGPSKPAWFALAASVLLAVFAGIRMIGPDVEYSLADEVLAHAYHEPASLNVTTVAVSDAELESVVPGDIAHMTHDAGLITYARTCPINGKDVPHLVIQGERGPVMILLMPDEPVDKAVPLEDETSHGVILPVGGGSIAIVAPRGESLERIEDSVLNSVAWST